MTSQWSTDSSPGGDLLSELNIRRTRANIRLGAARLAGDVAAQSAAASELAQLDEAIATVLATRALRNAAIARLGPAAA
ncbi:hypothetical protein [Rubellimicrobium arenae]|uniref:hypothetical protein n=1 Tax=Rubellimicrobium arenae TaxID=2817372 RepID=UPI001B315EEA|nr:hypothetical protein [Rubellimicrobium arenae]